MVEHSRTDGVPMLKNILALDVHLTKNFVKCMEKLLPKRQLKAYYKMLEISCHGVVWIVSLLALIWIFDNKQLYQMQVNLLMGLFLDVIVIAILKSIARRRRPAVNDDPLSMGPDKYSFPSGHVSRSMLIFYFFKYLWPVSNICLIPLLAWICAVALSRLLMRRHHILDVCAGLIVGYIEGMLTGILYLDKETCIHFILWLTNEKTDAVEDGA